MTSPEWAKTPPFLTIFYFHLLLLSSEFLYPPSPSFFQHQALSQTGHLCACMPVGGASSGAEAQRVAGVLNLFSKACVSDNCRRRKYLVAYVEQGVGAPVQLYDTFLYLVLATGPRLQ